MSGLPTELAIAREVAKENGWTARTSKLGTEVSFSRNGDRVRAGFTITERCNWTTEQGFSLGMGQRLGGDLSLYLGDLLTRLRQDPHPPMGNRTLIVTLTGPEADLDGFEKSVRHAVGKAVGLPARKRHVVVSTPSYDDVGNVIL